MKILLIASQQINKFLAWTTDDISTNHEVLKKILLIMSQQIKEVYFKIISQQIKRSLIWISDEASLYREIKKVYFKIIPEKWSYAIGTQLKMESDISWIEI